MSPDPQEADDLPELPELPDLPESGTSAASARAGTGERPPLRVLDRAPRHLRSAALIVVAGSALPWMPGRVEESTRLSWLLTLFAKLIMGAAAWLCMQQVLHDFGPRLQGVLGQLASLRLKPDKKPAEDDGRQRRAKPPTQLVHPFPTGMHALALVLALVALYVASNDPRKGLIGSNGVAEVAMLGWAAFTWVHIASYERWGGFNPLFPLMFLGMLFAGTAAVIRALGGEAGALAKLTGILGGAAVAAGGGLAVYTIAEAMMQAKKDGDRRKAEALEARRTARAKKAE